jgi:hypothetical protein
MLTTEKLFRGDTEFALMEKVRKAEVPPPSNFNRRVTPELDAIVLRALAPGVVERYQTAQQLAADLDALIAGYRFDPKELRQFMRQLFRKEYAKELEDNEVSLEAEPGLSASQSNPAASQPRQQTATSPGTEPTRPRVTMQGMGRPGTQTPTNPVERAEHSEEPLSDDGTQDKPRGFWGSLFRKRK